MRFTLGTCIPREISSITKEIKIKFTNFDLKKYLFLANPIPFIFGSFVKRKTIQLRHGGHIEHGQPRGNPCVK